MSKTKYFIELFLILIISFLTWKRANHLYDESLSKFRPPITETQESNDTDLLNIHLLKSPGPQGGGLQVDNPKKEKIIIGNENKNLFVFIQISDIHISHVNKKGGLIHLESFLVNELPLIGPELVLATGDLTDGKGTLHRSKQIKNEWLSYANLIENYKLVERRDGKFWFDQRGNHDCWNVASFTSAHNFYKTHSAQKTEGWVYTLVKEFGKYTFVALDGCPKTGPGRPFNFFGYFDTSDMDFLSNTILTSIKNAHNHTFAMSHYPTGTTLFGHSKQGVGFWDMTHHVSIWLCGHLHQLAGGLGDTMYAMQYDKVLELELGDMKTHGIFRIMAVDHDLVSFIDLPLYNHNLPLPLEADSNRPSKSPRPPIVLITNPKDARYVLTREPTSRIGTSSHIRVLVWAASPIALLRGYIDGSPLMDNKFEYVGTGLSWNSLKSLEEKDPFLPLWVIKWDPSKFDDDQVHLLTIVATDEQGGIGNHSVRFRVDGKRIVNIESGPGGFIISLPLGLLFRDLFFVSYFFICVGCLLIPKLFVLLMKGFGIYEKWTDTTSAKLILLDTESMTYKNQTRRPTFKEMLVHRWSDFHFTMTSSFFRFCELSCNSHLFYPLYFYALYITIGPWFVGDFVPSEVNIDPEGLKRYGWTMTYGIWLRDGSWEPILDTWFYAWYGVMYALFPLTWYLSFCIVPPSKLYSRSNGRLLHPIHLRSSMRFLVITVLIYHFFDTAGLSVFYGIEATFLSPGKSWLLIWAAVQLYRTTREATNGYSTQTSEQELKQD